MARNLANSLESLSGDIFTEYIRFLFELIQNADDSGATEVAIFLQNNYIIVSHSGKPFDQKDVEAICRLGEGTKKSEENKTGYKGIGFKSAFGKLPLIRIQRKVPYAISNQISICLLYVWNNTLHFFDPHFRCSIGSDFDWMTE